MQTCNFDVNDAHDNIQGDTLVRATTMFPACLMALRSQMVVFILISYCVSLQDSFIAAMNSGVHQFMLGVGDIPLDHCQKISSWNTYWKILMEYY